MFWNVPNEFIFVNTKSNCVFRFFVGPVGTKSKAGQNQSVKWQTGLNYDPFFITENNHHSTSHEILNEIVELKGTTQNNGIQMIEDIALCEVTPNIMENYRKLNLGTA